MPKLWSASSRPRGPSSLGEAARGGVVGDVALHLGFDADADAASLDAPPPAAAAAGVQEVTKAEVCARGSPTCASGERKRGGGAKEAPPEVPHEGVDTGRRFSRFL